MVFRALIVDDEPRAIRSLKTVLQWYCEGEVEVVGEAHAPSEAWPLVKSQKPALIFLDIDMGEENGFMLLEKIKQLDQPPAVIFTTAHSKYAIEALRKRAFDYLLKPIEGGDLQAAIARLKESRSLVSQADQSVPKSRLGPEDQASSESKSSQESKAEPESQASSESQPIQERFTRTARDKESTSQTEKANPPATQRTSPKEVPSTMAPHSGGPLTLSLPMQDQVRVVTTEEIIRLESERNYTRFHLIDGSVFLISKHLGPYAELLQAHQFFRSHKSHLINLKHLQSYVRQDGGYLLMKDGSEVPISRAQRPVLFEILGI